MPKYDVYHILGTKMSNLEICDFLLISNQKNQKNLTWDYLCITQVLEPTSNTIIIKGDFNTQIMLKCDVHRTASGT